MKAHTAVGPTISGFGMSTQVLCITAIVLVTVAGLVNWIFGWWTHVPTPIFYVACVLGPLIFLIKESSRPANERLAKTTSEMRLLIFGAIVSAVFLTWFFPFQFGHWFREGGMGWFKIGAALIGTMPLGAIVGMVGSFLTTGGR